MPEDKGSRTDRRSKNAIVDAELVTELAKAAVEDCAPHELPLFEATSRRYVEDPGGVERAASRDEILGFGVETAGALAPFALAVAAPVVRVLFEIISESVRAEASEVVGDLVKKLFKRFRDADEAGPLPPSLSAEQLGRVRNAALEKARQLRLSEEQANLLADSMVGSLVGA